MNVNLIFTLTIAAAACGLILAIVLGLIFLRTQGNGLRTGMAVILLMVAGAAVIRILTVIQAMLNLDRYLFLGPLATLVIWIGLDCGLCVAFFSLRKKADEKE